MKKLLIIKPDHIGDYIVFRNYLEVIKNSDRFKDYQIHFLGNERIRDIAEYLDGGVVDKFIWIDLGKYTIDSWYTKLRNNEILCEDYDTVLNLKFFAYKTIEALVKNINANTKICVKTILTKVSRVYMENMEANYDQIIDIADNQVFKFERFRLAFEKLLNTKITIKKPIINLHSTFNVDFNYMVIYIGADNHYRKWHINNYVALVEYIINRYDIKVIVCGGPNEFEESELLLSRCKNKNIINLVGETTTLDLLHIIANSKFVVSNETGAVHISMALDIPTLVISNGNSFGKFTPYPKAYTNKYFVVYPFQIKNQNDYDKYVTKYYINVSELDINNITIDNVIKCLNDLCNKFNIKQSKTPKPEIHENRYVCHLSSPQENDNYLFSAMFSKLTSNIYKLKELNKKMVIYGNTSFGKYLLSILDKNIVCIVDKKSQILYSNNNNAKDNVFSLDSLQYITYDQIIISVLGRENGIIDDLISNYNVKQKDIFVFKIIKKKYIGC